MKMHATRDALLSHGFTHDVREPFKELAAAEELAAMLREVCETHWQDGQYEGGAATMRAAVRKAETLLARFGVP